jgi:hypothetical protein
MTIKDGKRVIHYTEVGELPRDSEIYQESQTYRRELPRLLAEGHESKFALIKGDEIIGIFVDEREAMRVGYERYLLQPFMVQPIREWEPLIRLPWYCWPCPT